jgi:hypothetical protein
MMTRVDSMRISPLFGAQFAETAPFGKPSTLNGFD